MSSRKHTIVHRSYYSASLSPALMPLPPPLPLSCRHVALALSLRHRFLHPSLSSWSPYHRQLYRRRDTHGTEASSLAAQGRASLFSMEAYPKRMSAFSAGLGFTSKDIRGETGGETPAFCASATTRASEGESLSALQSEEERLLAKAALLRRTIEDELIPRHDTLERAVRQGRRDWVEVQRQLPCPAFMAFRQCCISWLCRLRVFEEQVVHTMLRNAVERAVRGGDVAEPARWRKSKQWPALTTFLDLQLYLSSASTASTSSEETRAILGHLATTWREHLGGPLRPAFLERFYTLRDALHGWGAGWRVRPSCPMELDTASPLSSRKSSSCTYAEWESIAAVDLLGSYACLCPRHIAPAIVESLETMVTKHFADVWHYVSLTEEPES